MANETSRDSYSWAFGTSIQVNWFPLFQPSFLFVSFLFICLSRKPLNNTPTCHLFVDGCGLSQFNESDCRSWIECFPAIVAATLVAQRPFLYLSCGSVDEARHLRTQLSRPDLLNHITRDHGRSIVECIKRVDFAVQCRWLDVIPPKPDSFVSSTSLLIPSSPEYLCPVDGLHVVDVGNVICLEELRLQFNKLKWKKALRKSGRNYSDWSVSRYTKVDTPKKTNYSGVSEIINY